MYKLRYSEQAKHDLLAIQRYIATQSGNPQMGRDFTRRLREKCRELASISGQIGVARPELREHIRSQPFGNYVLFFRYEGDCFKVITIIEGHRDINSMFDASYPA